GEAPSIEQRVADAEAAARPARRRRRRRSHPAAWPWRFVFPLVTLAAAVAIPVFWKVAAKAVLESTAGVTSYEISDPTAPNYVALVDPTETFLAIHVDDSDTLVGASLLTLKDKVSGGGTIVGIPAEFLGSPADSETLEALHLSYSIGGVERVVDAIARSIGTRPLEYEVLPPSVWASLISPVAGFEYSVLDDLSFRSADGSLLTVSSGVARVGADELLVISSALDNKPGINRAERIERLWTRWIEAIRTSRSQPTIGGGSAKLEEYVARLAPGQVSYQPLPTAPFRVDDGDQPIYVSDSEQVETLVHTVIPFPIPYAPGAIPSVELINGAGDIAVNDSVIGAVVDAGGLLSVISNPPVFGVAKSRIAYFNETHLDLVTQLAADLGGIDVQFFAADDPEVDVRITIGTDYRP
ncbi:MAG: hypothetical protein V3V01_05510, partial [Acidimicrobiales bacterium]